jgi:hypothetical protein
MFQMITRFLSNDNGTTGLNDSADQATPVPASPTAPPAELAVEPQRRLSVVSTTTALNNPATSEYATFEQIYESATVKPPRLAWGILKVAAMMDSPHATNMSPQVKRSSVLMALEAVGVEVEHLLQDAVVRQRALEDYEQRQKSAVETLEAAKLKENRSIQAELDRLTAQYLSRIQANLDEVAAAKDRLYAWQKQREHESHRITEAAALCVPNGPVANTGLVAVLERATAARA